MTAPTVESPDLETLSEHWQWALDAVAHALDAADGSIPISEIGDDRRRLAHERQETATLLARDAAVRRAEGLPWLPPFCVTPHLLGLPDDVRACIFDFEGVLTDSNVLHAEVWASVFDELLLQFAHERGWPYLPFDADLDYRTYFEARQRLEGIHSFLASRGIRVPEGRADDSAQTNSAWGIARRKGDRLARELREQGLTTFAGARRYLQAAGHARLARAVVSASTSTEAMLRLSGLEHLVEVRVDAEAMRAGALRSRPSPDILIAACHRLGVAPEHAATFTHSGAGVTAGLAAGLTVIGVADGSRSGDLRDFGAPNVVPNVAALLDRRLVSGMKNP